MATDIFRIDGKTALVTGASSGIGRRCALTLAAAGARLYVAARRELLLQELQQEIADAGGVCTSLSVDVTDSDSVATAVQRIGAEGGLDILINNAGYGESITFLDMTEVQWHRMIDTNLTGAWRVASEAARLMRDSGKGGNIINTASVLGVRQAPHITHYAVAKAGLVQMTKQLALELARYQIRVNALIPGYIYTAINDIFLDTPDGKQFISRVPMRRYGQVEELDGPLLLLASDAGSYMTGACIAVDGGHLVNSL